MYKVLLVDDEPLVLAGIKIMTNWEALNCKLVGSVRNGQQALDAIPIHLPNIIIADINMPILDGIALLRQCAEEHPHIVFIMLTNLEEFSLAQNAIRHKAVEYLIKTQLDQDMLEAAITKAKLEVEMRRELHKVKLVKNYIQTGQEELLKSAATQITSPKGVCPDALLALQDEGIIDSYMLAQIYFDYPARFTAPVNLKQIRQLHLWGKEIVEEIASNCFARHALAPVVSPSAPNSMLVWAQNGPQLEKQMHRFREKLSTALHTLAGIKPLVIATEALHGTDSLTQCHKQICHLQNELYNTGESRIYEHALPFTAVEHLPFSGASQRLQNELQAKNRKGVSAVFERVITQIQTIHHEKPQAIWLCEEFLSVAEKADYALPLNEDFYWLSSKDAHYCLHLLLSKQEVIEFLQLLKKEYINILHVFATGGNDVIVKVHQYVAAHIEDRIMLQEIAKEVSLTPTYLSALYKKRYGENLIDYINHAKIQRACELIAMDKYKICQIAYKLGFENPYYFSRVFKKHTGITPSEYADTDRL